MKQVNPKLLVPGYVNGTFAQADEGTAYPDLWYARGRQRPKGHQPQYGKLHDGPR